MIVERLDAAVEIPGAAGEFKAEFVARIFDSALGPAIIVAWPRALMGDAARPRSGRR
jgi:hypothetical protein